MTFRKWLALLSFALAWIVSAVSPVRSADAPGENVPLADAVECHPRGGLPAFFQKLAAGQEVRIAYLGGSITEANGWRPLTLRWFQQEYPKAKVVEINAAIAGTGSDFGACRLRREVLDHDPDLIFVEFAVNDTGRPAAQIIRCMEGIVRQTRRARPQTGVCFVYTLSKTSLPTLQAGKFSPEASAMERVAERYAVPSIHLGLEVARLEKEGKLVFTGPKPSPAAGPADPSNPGASGKIVFSPDGTHPYPDTGHLLYLAATQRSMPPIQAATAAPPGSPAPLDAANWENARAVPLSEVARLTPDWSKLDAANARAAALRAQAHDPVRQVWVAEKPGAEFTFRFEGTGFGLYGLKGPDSGAFAVTVDGGGAVTDSLFDAFCTPGHYRIKPWFYPRPLANGSHEVKVTLLPGTGNKGVILHLPHPEDGNTGEYADNRLYVSDVLLPGTPGTPAPQALQPR